MRTEYHPNDCPGNATETPLRKDRSPETGFSEGDPLGHCVSMNVHCLRVDDSNGIDRFSILVTLLIRQCHSQPDVEIAASSIRTPEIYFPLMRFDGPPGNG